MHAKGHQEWTGPTPLAPGPGGDPPASPLPPGRTVLVARASGPPRVVVDHIRALADAGYDVREIDVADGRSGRYERAEALVFFGDRHQAAAAAHRLAVPLLLFEPDRGTSASLPQVLAAAALENHTVLPVRAAGRPPRTAYAEVIVTSTSPAGPLEAYIQPSGPPIRTSCIRIRNSDPLGVNDGDTVGVDRPASMIRLDWWNGEEVEAVELRRGAIIEVFPCDPGPLLVETDAGRSAGIGASVRIGPGKRLQVLRPEVQPR